MAAPPKVVATFILALCLIAFVTIDEQSYTAQYKVDGEEQRRRSLKAAQAIENDKTIEVSQNEKQRLRRLQKTLDALQIEYPQIEQYHREKQRLQDSLQMENKIVSFLKQSLVSVVVNRNGNVNDDIMEAIGTAIEVGALYVLTGIECLVAIATLIGMDIVSSSNEKNDHFVLGVLWGLGYSISLLIVGSILLSQSNPILLEVDNHWIAILCQSLMGISMILLGTYGLRIAYSDRKERSITVSISPLTKKSTQERKQMYRGNESVHSSSIQSTDSLANKMQQVLTSDSMSIDVDSDDDEVEDSIPQTFKSLEGGGASRSKSFLEYQEKSKSNLKLLKASTAIRRYGDPDKYIVPPAGEAKTTSFSCCFSRSGNIICCTNTSILALITGLVQGVACSTNPQGAVLPVVSQLHNGKIVAATYLIVLCVTCTCVMGILAALYGVFSEWALAKTGSGGGSKQQQNKCNRICLSLVEDVPACLSIAMGISWLVLLIAGISIK